MKLTSTLESIVSKIFVSKSLKESQDILLEFLKDSKIKISDKNKMINEIKLIPNINKLQFYCCNALLKYEGLSVNIK